MAETRNSRTHPGDGFYVRAKQCETCIYRPGLAWNLPKLEGEVRAPDGSPFEFDGFRECHHGEADGRRGSGACCRGFWNRHRNNCKPIVIAQGLVRLGYGAIIET